MRKASNRHRQPCTESEAARVLSKACMAWRKYSLIIRLIAGKSSAEMTPTKTSAC